MKKYDHMTAKMADFDSRFRSLGIFLCILAVSDVSGYSDGGQILLESICGSTSKDYNTDTLVKPRSWYLNYTQSPQVCIGNGSGGQTGCNFTLAFCQPVNCSSTNTSLMNASACITTGESGNQTILKLGSYNSSVNPFIADNDTKVPSFLMRYTNGSNFTTADGKSCNLSIDLQFHCNHTSLWSAAGDRASINSTVLNNVTYDGKTCKYILAFNYSGACPAVTPFPPGDLHPGVSFGTVLLIVFILLISVYCVFGFMCKFASGYRGKEALPHSEFWTAIPSYIKDGFHYTCNCCKPDSSTSSYDTI